MTKQITESLRLLNEKIDGQAEVLNDKRKDMHTLRETVQTLSLEQSLIKENLKENTLVTKSISEVMPTILQIVEILDSVKGGLKVLGYLGKALGWISGIAVSLYGLWEIKK